MKVAAYFLAICCSLTACVSQAEMDALPPQRAIVLNENYQVVYARLNKALRVCDRGPVDAQIYSGLGYGEITIAINGTPYEHAKIVGHGSSTTVELKSVRKAIVPDAAETAVRWMEYYARGGTACQSLKLSTPPSL